MINEETLENRDAKRNLLELLYRLDENGNKTFLFDLNQLNPFSLDAVRIYRAKNFIFNKVFEQTYFKNDIALIELERDIRFSDSIRPICLIDERMYLNDQTFKMPEIENNDLIRKIVSNSFNEQDKSDVNVMISKFEIEERWLKHQQFEAYGFGRTGFNKAGSKQLQKLTFHYEPLKKCKDVWEKRIKFFGSLIDETHLCVLNKYSTIW